VLLLTLIPHAAADRLRDPFRHENRREGDAERYQGQPERPGFAAWNLREGVDQRRQRLRLAGNIRHEGDGGAELAHGAREGENGAGDDPGQNERQRDRGEHPEPARAEGRCRLFQPDIDRLDGELDGADHERKPHDGAGQRGTSPAKREHDAERLLKKVADRASTPEQQQQDVAGDDRRQHERQMNQAVKQRAAPELSARQRVGDEYAYGQARQRRHRRDLQRQPNCRHFLLAQSPHCRIPMHSVFARLRRTFFARLRRTFFRPSPTHLFSPVSDAPFLPVSDGTAL